MKLLQLGKYFPPYSGGVEQTTFDLARSIPERDVTPDVLCFNDRMNYSEEEGPGYRIFRASRLIEVFSTPLSLQYMTILARKWKEYDALLVHLPNPLANLALFLVRPKRPLILFWHSDIIKQKIILFFYEPLLKWLIKRADLVIGFTENHLRASKYAHLFQGKGVVIPYPFDAGRLSEDRMNHDLYGKLQENFREKHLVFTLGRLIYYKGFHHLIEAARYLSDDYRIVIGGSGPLKEELEGRIKEAGLETRVTLAGRIPNEDLSAWYRAARVFCLPSTHKSEMFGVVQLEAMACGTPVVSTDIPGSGVPLVNIDGRTGRVVPVADPESLAGAIRFICEEAGYAAMQDAAREHVETRYAHGPAMDRFAETFRSLLPK